MLLSPWPLDTALGLSSFLLCCREPLEVMKHEEACLIMRYLKAILILPLVNIYWVPGAGIREWGSLKCSVLVSVFPVWGPWPMLFRCLWLLCSGLKYHSCIFLSCLQWLETRPNRQVCPVCKAGISRDKVIPLYGRGSTGQQDPRWGLGAPLTPAPPFGYKFTST